MSGFIFLVYYGGHVRIDLSIRRQRQMCIRDRVMTDLLSPRDDYDYIYLFSQDGTLKIKEFSTSKLKSIWTK